MATLGRPGLSLVTHMFSDTLRWECDFQGTQSKDKCHLGLTVDGDIEIACRNGHSVIKTDETNVIQYFHRDHRAVITLDDGSVHTFTDSGRRSEALQRITYVLGEHDQTVFVKHEERRKLTTWTRR